MPAQLSFAAKHATFRAHTRTQHGGGLAKGRRKLYRPFDPRRPLHLTLRSERARGAWSLLDPDHERRIKHLVYRFADKNGVRIFNYANSGNHLHLLVQSKDPARFKAFLRTIAGLIARAVTGARKGKRITGGGRFWSELVWSRLVHWGRDFIRAQDYVVLNEMEAAQVWRREWSYPDSRKRRGLLRNHPSDH